MRRLNKSSLVAFALVSACIGEGIDTGWTRSNCPWNSTGDFAGEGGYRLFHQVPQLCPQEVIVRSPWFANDDLLSSDRHRAA